MISGLMAQPRTGRVSALTLLRQLGSNHAGQLVDRSFVDGTGAQCIQTPARDYLQNAQAIEIGAALNSVFRHKTMDEALIPGAVFPNVVACQN